MSATNPTMIPPILEQSRPPGRTELLRLLALVWRSVDWQAQGGKSWDDRWAGMMITASTGESVGEVINTLCSRLGVGIPRERERGEIGALLAVCEPHANDLLDWLDRESIPVAAMSAQAARELRS